MDRRARVLAELGLVRWRLRVPRTGAVAATTAPTVTSNGASLPRDRPALRVAAVDLAAAPVDGIAAVIWSQVLAWLGRRSDEIEWCAVPDATAIVLPPASNWRTPEGKRALWLALKAHVRTR